MNSKIKTYLISKGIDFSVPFLVDENHLEKIDEKYIYQNTCFENKLIKYTMLGKKKELFLRNCKIEATSLSSLDITVYLTMLKFPNVILKMQSFITAGLIIQ